MLIELDPAAHTATATNVLLPLVGGTVTVHTDGQAVTGRLLAVGPAEVSEPADGDTEPDPVHQLEVLADSARGDGLDLAAVALSDVTTITVHER